MTQGPSLNWLVFCTSCLLGCFNESYAGEISFKDRLQRANKQNVVTIQANPNDVLIIEPGTYSLKGRRLILAAEHVKISVGEAIVQSFDSSDVRPSKSGAGPSGPPQPTAGNCRGDGCPGADGNRGGNGDVGADGVEAQDFSINIGNLEGAGILRIITNGQTGGKGQKGGKGGTGGQGGKGSKRSCGGLAGLDTKANPGNGGSGGTGGTGGAGGIGGKGGNSGSVLIDERLFKWVAIRRVVVDTSGGKGGQGGDPGDSGDSGLGNDGGQGNSCGGGGTASGPGRQGEAGAKGPFGEAGRAGAVLYSRFDGQNPTELPSNVTVVAKNVELTTAESKGLPCKPSTISSQICVNKEKSITMTRAILLSSENVSQSEMLMTRSAEQPLCVNITGSITGVAAKRLVQPGPDSVLVLGKFKVSPSFPFNMPYCMMAKASYDLQILTLPAPDEETAPQGTVK